MYFTCNNMMNLVICKNLRLISGADGLENVIRWFYIIESEQDIDRLQENVKDGDMLIITGFPSKNVSEVFHNVFQIAVEKRVSSIVIYSNVGADIADSTILDVSEQKKLPVFILDDSDIPVTDLTYGIADGILKQADEKYGQKNILYDLIHNNFGNKETLLQRTEYFNYNILRPQRVVIIKLYLEDLQEASRMAARDKIWAICENLIKRYFLQSMTMQDMDMFIALLPDSTNDLRENFQLLGKKILENFPKGRYIVAIGNQYDEFPQFYMSYNEALNILRFSEKKKTFNSIYEISDLLDYLTLMELKESSLLTVHRSRISGLLEEKNKDLLDTVKTYFECNCNMQKTAEKLFIHRNTMKQRLDRIGDLCGFDLRNFNDCFKVRMALLIEELKLNELI